METNTKKDDNLKKASSIQYSGKVTITVKRGNKIISRKTSSNNGTSLLFKTLCRCLCKDEDAINLMPFYIDVGEQTPEGFQTGLVTPCVITKRVTQNIAGTDTFVAQFVATLLYSQLLDSSKPLKTTALKNIDRDILATMTMENGISIENSKYTVLLEWEMSFSNSTNSTIEQEVNS